MKLDRRIKDGRRPFGCFDTNEAKGFMYKVCYFAHDETDFEDIKRNTTKGFLTRVEPNSDGHKFFYSGIDGFEFCIPEDYVSLIEEFRPYTLSEWKRNHPLGTEVVFRKKRKDLESAESTKPVMHRVFLGYDEGNVDSEMIHLGYSAFTLETLFEKYEIYEDGTWKPFGVNCKSDNPVLNKIIRDAIDNVRCY